MQEATRQSLGLTIGLDLDAPIALSAVPTGLLGFVIVANIRLNAVLF